MTNSILPADTYYNTCFAESQEEVLNIAMVLFAGKAPPERCGKAIDFRMWVLFGNRISRHEAIRHGAGNANLAVGYIYANGGADAERVRKALDHIAVNVKNHEVGGHAAVFFFGVHEERLHFVSAIVGDFKKKLVDVDKLVHLRLIDDVIAALAQFEDLFVHDANSADVFFISQAIHLFQFEFLPFSRASLSIFSRLCMRSYIPNTLVCKPAT